MPRDLKPAIIAFPHALQKGALILLPRPAPAKGKAPAGAGAGGSTTGTQLRFQYNPETVTRARSGAWEARKTQKSSSKGSGGPTAPQNQTLEAFQGGGLYAKSETLTIKLIFDATELLLSAPPAAGGAPPADDDRSLGILPELAVLERMAIANPRADESKDGTKPAGKDSKLDAVVPSELLLVLGARAFPVVITSMTITEKRFSPTLVPLRAEIDLQMQLLESHEVEGNQPIKAAYEQLRKQREDNAAKAAQSVTVGNDGKLDAINQALSQKFETGGA